MTTIVLTLMVATLIVGVVLIIKGLIKTFSRVQEKLEKEKTTVVVKEKNVKKIFLVTIVLALVGIGLTLPFHYVPDVEEKIDHETGRTYQLSNGYHIFPKERLTFKDTFIGNETIQREVNRYNNANYLQRQAIEAEYLHIKLKEYGLIWNKSENQSIQPSQNNEDIEEKIIRDINNLPEVRSLELTEYECGAFIAAEPDEENPYYVVWVSSLPCSNVMYEYHVYTSPKYRIVLKKD